MVTTVSGNGICLKFSWNMLAFKQQLSNLDLNKKVIRSVPREKGYFKLEFFEPILKSEAILCMLDLDAKDKVIRETDWYWTFSNTHQKDENLMTFITRFNQKGRFSHYLIPKELEKVFPIEFILSSLRALGSGNLLFFLFTKKYRCQPSFLAEEYPRPEGILRFFGQPLEIKSNEKIAKYIFEYNLTIHEVSKSKIIKSMPVQLGFTFEEDRSSLVELYFNLGRFQLIIPYSPL